MLGFFGKKEVRRGVMPSSFQHCTIAALHTLTDELLEAECWCHDCKKCRWRIPQEAREGSVIALLKNGKVRLAKEARP